MTNSWYQPAIDAFGHALMERFNKVPDHRGLTSRFAPGPANAQGAELQPIVYVTYQAYLRRSVPTISALYDDGSDSTDYLTTLERQTISHAHSNSRAGTTTHLALNS